MKLKSIIFFSLLIVIIGYACTKNSTQRRTPPPTGGDNSYKLYSDIVYGSNVDYFKNTDQLAMDIYVPSDAVGTSTTLPLLLYVHGGGFIKGDKTTNEDFLVKMVNKNFIVASINYRMGRTYDSTNLCNGDTTELKQALYRAVQDCNASLRFLVANAKTYNIDTSWIFTAGSSAGCATVLGSHYYSTDDLATYGGDYRSTLGGLYDADNNLTNTYTIKGICAQWGDIADLKLIDDTTAVPMVFFHGGEDSAAPYNYGPVYYCPNFMTVFGSKAMYEKLQSLGISSILHVDPTGGHGVFDADFIGNNTACFFNDVIAGKKDSGIYSGYKSSCN